MVSTALSCVKLAVDALNCVDQEALTLKQEEALIYLYNGLDVSLSALV